MFHVNRASSLRYDTRGFRTAGLLRATATLLLLTAPLAAAEKKAESVKDPAAQPVDLPHGSKALLASAKSIFDGKTTEGWKAIGGGKWSVQDGAVVGVSGDGEYGWLVYEKPQADFILTFECKHDDHGNSGIQFRSHVIEEHMCGYQADFDADNEKVGGTGGIYDEGPGGRGWLSKPDEQKIKSLQKPLGQWNAYKIQAIGDHLQTWVNDELVSDIRDHQNRSGVIALQVHSGKKPPVNVSFRKIKLTDLGDGKGWKPLFDGKTLKGWRTQGTPDTWRVEGGHIIGEMTKPSPYCYLASDKKYADFEFKGLMKFDSNSGNSGVFFRSSFPPWHAQCGGPGVARDLPEDTSAAQFKCPKCGSTDMAPMGERVHIHGTQAEFALKDQHNGFIYDARGHGWVNVPGQVTPNRQNIYQFKEWNEMRILAKGNHIMTWINGYLVSDISDYDFPKTGILALQLHESKDVIKVEFKDLQIRTLE